MIARHCWQVSRGLSSFVRSGTHMWYRWIFSVMRGLTILHGNWITIPMVILTEHPVSSLRACLSSWIVHFSLIQGPHPYRHLYWFFLPVLAEVAGCRGYAPLGISASVAEINLRRITWFVLFARLCKTEISYWRCVELMCPLLRSVRSKVTRFDTLAVCWKVDRNLWVLVRWWSVSYQMMLHLK